MPAFTDQLGRTVIVGQPPARIVSLVPSQTELLYSLNAAVVGITKFCVRPASWFRSLTRVGGTKDVNLEKIAGLHPDLIIANKEENDRGQIELLSARYPVWVSDIHTLDDALAMIRSLGMLVGETPAAASLAADIQARFDDLAGASLPRSMRTAYLIWRTADPLSFMAAGGDTFIHDMLSRCGLINLFAGRPRYPAIGPESLADSDLVLLSSEPYPFRERHAAELRALLPHANVRLVDGEMFSWYGSRLLQAPAYFLSLFSKAS